MKINDLAKIIQDDLHDIVNQLGYDVTFVVTADIQKYESYMKTKDNDNYIPIVIKRLNDTYLFTDFDIRVTDYQLSIYGLASKRKDIEDIFKEYSKRDYAQHIDMNGEPFYVYSQQMVTDSFITTTDGANTRRFLATVDIQIQVPPKITKGSDVTLIIDGLNIPFYSIRFRKDKSLIPNVEFNGVNSSLSLTNEILVLEIPLSRTSGIQALLQEVLEYRYNITHEIKLEFKLSETRTLTKEALMVTRIGNIEFGYDNEPIAMFVTFERALTRRDFKVDGEIIPVIQWGYGSKSQNISISTVNGIKNKPINQSRQINAVFAYSFPNIMLENIINEINNNTERVFEVEYQIGPNLTYTYNMIVDSGNILVTENPDMIVEVTFIESV